MAHLTYPNESPEYREARNALLDAEIALRAQVEAVAAQRRALPPGGEVAQDYEFERIGAGDRTEKVRISELFDAHDTLILYSFMYGPEAEEPCPGCVAVLDSANGAARHLERRAAFWIVAKSPIARLMATARKHGWDRLKFLSAAGNSYPADYYGDVSKLPAAVRESCGVADGEDWDQMGYNVFRMDDGVVRHFWGSELVYAPAEPNQDHRAGDLAHALWGHLDMTPEGRGAFFPSIRYD